MVSYIPILAWASMLLFLPFFSGGQVPYLLRGNARSPGGGKIFIATGTQHRAVVSRQKGKLHVITSRDFTKADN